jgi:bacillithiol biosynthesis cysteine-adding enzyme BshC
MSAASRSPALPEIHTEPLATGGLAALAVSGRAPEDWYARCPGTPAEWRARAGQVRESSGRSWLSRLAPAFEATGAAAARLARGADGRGVVVTTGQQPGLFGGPIYTWSKALAALALADAIERETGIPAAPVFWAATDDADFAEASFTYVGTPAGAERVEMPPPAVAGLPMARTPLGDVAAQRELLARGAGSAPYALALELTRAAYGPGETVGSAYVRLLRTLLEPLGIAVLDASHPAVRAAARPTLVAALTHAGAIDDALRARENAIVAAGFAPQVPGVPGLTQLFERASADKQRVPIARAAAVGADPEADLGPNVLLRPIVERAILPTVAYVAGPGEIAYFAQVSALAAALGTPAPLAVPRWSGTIVEPHVRRALDRLGVDRDALRDPHALETRVAAAAIPADARDSVQRLRDAIAALDGGGLLPDDALAGARAQLELRAGRLERRLRAQVKRRGDDALRDVATARASLFPAGKRQERALNFIPLLARYGPALIDAMRERASDEMSALVRGTARP